MSTLAKLTMIGLYNYNASLFDEMALPPEIDKQVFIDSFLLKYGEAPVIYPSWDTMKFALGVFSKKWYHSIERIIRAMLEDYDPLHNFDRYEEYTDTEGKEGENKLNLDSTDTTKTSGGSTVTADVSAYNESTYSPDTKETTDNDMTVETEHIGSNTATSSEDRELKHIGHLYGNIGVTQSTQMLLSETEARMNNNIIDIVSDMLYKEVCIYVY